MLCAISSMYLYCHCSFQQSIQADSMPTLPGTRAGTVRSVVFMLPWHERYRSKTFVACPSVRHSATQYVSSPNIFNVCLQGFMLVRGFKIQIFILKLCISVCMQDPVSISLHVHTLQTQIVVCNDRKTTDVTLRSLTGFKNILNRNCG
jgi:hypothetical protein